MADLEELAALARDTERAAVPDFDHVVARARRQRRRRQAALATAAAVLLVGGTVTATTLPHGTDTSPPVTQQPEKHRPTKAGNLTARQRIWVALDRGETRFVTAADPEHVLIAREYCPRPHHCWWGSKITGIPDSTRPASQVHDRGASAGPNGFWIGEEGPFLGLDGRVRRAAMRYVPLSQASRPGPDAVFTMLNDNGFFVYEPTRNRYWSVNLPGVTQPPIQQLLLTDGGRIWMQQGFGDTGNIVSSSDDGGHTWTHHPLPRVPRNSHYGRMLCHAGTAGVPVFDAQGLVASFRVLDGSRWDVVPTAGTPIEGIRAAVDEQRVSEQWDSPLASLSDGSLYAVRGAMWQAAPDSWTRWTDLGSTPVGLRLAASPDVLLGTTGSRQVWVYQGGDWQAVD